ncbi:hypothetical protein, partial [Phytomonospora endophytica]|uniref:hypothetical protein n=1 Tax=Phytomonospora endophytica TaxID=714109 RepID=UPI001944A1ED
PASRPRPRRPNKHSPIPYLSGGFVRAAQNPGAAETGRVSPVTELLFDDFRHPASGIALNLPPGHYRHVGFRLSPVAVSFVMVTSCR